MLANFHPEAQAELNHAIVDYEANHLSLGYQFAIEIFCSSGNAPPSRARLLE